MATFYIFLEEVEEYRSQRTDKDKIHVKGF